LRQIPRLQFHHNNATRCAKVPTKVAKLVASHSS